MNKNTLPKPTIPWCGFFYFPIPIEPEDEKAELQRKFIESVKAQERLVTRLAELNMPMRIAK